MFRLFSSCNELPAGERAEDNETSLSLFWSTTNSKLRGVICHSGWKDGPAGTIYQPLSKALNPHIADYTLYTEFT